MWVLLALLWLAGNDLRLTVLAVPPVLPAIHHDLHLSETLIGALTALPVLLLAAAAVPGSLLVARFGARRALILGLLVVGLAGAARGVGGAAPVLFAMTFLMGAGIAVSQPSLPSLVRQWFPGRLGTATAIYSNGFLTGEVFAAALTASLIVPLMGGSWQLALAFWSIPVALTAAALALLTGHERREPGSQPLRWWPDWKSGLTWRLGLIFGCASISYFGSNAFIPDYLKSAHHAALIGPALTSLNLCQLPASLLVATLPGRLVARRWPIFMAGLLMLAAVSSFAAVGLWLVAGAGLLGFASGLIFVLCLSLPPILAEAHDVHRLSAAMFTITYTCSFLGSLVGGAVWDLTRVPLTAFVPVMAAGVATTILVSGLDLQGPLRSTP